MGLRDIGHTLPPGFRFYPSDEELVCHYLFKKIANEQVVRGTLVEIDLHTCEPWQLPDMAKLNSNEWYFFSFRDRKYATGFRANRATVSGYWKATGKDRAVLDPSSRAVVGMRKTLVFYKHRAPNGIKTGWIMHEFRLENPHVPPKEDWVLCRVFYKSRGENSNRSFSPQDHVYNDASDTSPTTYQEMNNISSHQLPQNPSTSLALSPLDSPYFHPVNGMHPSSSNQNNFTKLIEAKCEDDYGFLFDMSLDYSNVALAPSNEVEDHVMRTFDDDMMTSSVFI